MPAPVPAPSRAMLVLEDGRTFHGDSYGAPGETFGEAVFSTGMSGYQETLTDPSYHRQVVVMTSPHVGNTGMNDEDPESRRIWVSGYVVRDPARVPSSWRSTRTLDDALREQGVVGISGVDTRALTRHLRSRGAMRVGISTVDLDPASLLTRVQAAPEMVGADHPVALARDVMRREVPLFGICFGSQILGRALGFGTYKLGYGHRGINQPVLDRATGKVEVTSHNHGFAVEWPADRPTPTAYGEATVSHVCLNDDVVEGLELRGEDGRLRAFSVQYHPEAAAGPHDAAYLFDRFVGMLAVGQGRA